MDTVNTFVTAQTLGPYEPGTTDVRIETAADGTTRYFRARHVSDTKGPSGYSATVSGAPIAIGDAV